MLGPRRECSHGGQGLQEVLRLTREVGELHGESFFCCASPAAPSLTRTLHLVFNLSLSLSARVS